MYRFRNRSRRSGATVVESALVIGIMLFVTFSVFEYCRYLMVLTTLEQSARSGARYASVNVWKPTNFDTVDYNDGTTTYTNITDYTKNMCGGMDATLGSLSVSVFPCDMTKLAQTPPVIQAKSGYPTTVYWNSATFTEKIAVQITGTYSSVVPNIVFWKSSFSITVTAVTNSEG
jgi:Flp pilus assembly protein TadG